MSDPEGPCRASVYTTSQMTIVSASSSCGAVGARGQAVPGDDLDPVEDPEVLAGIESGPADGILARIPLKSTGPEGAPEGI